MTASPATASDWIRRLELKPHPEGGYFAEIYRSEDVIAAAGLPPRFGDLRHAATSIYYLLERPQVSAFHRIRSDEIWHWLTGVALTISVLKPGGDLDSLHLGPATDRDEAYVRVVPAGCWFGAQCVEDGFALVGCTVAPGFAFEDFELADRDALLQDWPRHEDLIRALTRG
jgi:predicted cupin superfamily sugar epimerase